jgi:RNA polymerase sigma-70 factor (ECF subfamily)
MRAYQRIDLFEWRNISLSAWFYKIAGNEIRKYFRKAKYSPTCLEDLELTSSIAYEEGIETERGALEKSMQEYKEFHQVQEELKRLGLKYQEVIALRFFEEKSIKAISEILGKNEGTVKSLLSRGLQKLRVAIQRSSGF